MPVKVATMTILQENAIKNRCDFTSLWFLVVVSSIQHNSTHTKAIGWLNGLFDSMSVMHLTVMRS